MIRLWGEEAPVYWREGRTWTNSTGALSPVGLAANSLVAGKALGTMFTEERLRGFVTTRDDMDTAKSGAVSDEMAWVGDGAPCRGEERRQLW